MKTRSERRQSTLQTAVRTVTIWKQRQDLEEKYFEKRNSKPPWKWSGAYAGVRESESLENGIGVAKGGVCAVY